MKRLPLALLSVLVLVSCADEGPLSPDLPSGVQPVFELVDGANGEGGNESFFFLRPLTSVRNVDGEADASLNPVVEVCLRNAAGDGCDETQPPLVSFERGDGPQDDRVKVDGRGNYFVHWNMSKHEPDRDAVYRIRVLLQGSEFGHVDVLAMRENEIKAYRRSGGELFPISERGAFRIAFRINEGGLEQQFCDVDGDGDAENCSAAVETPGDGEPTVIVVESADPEGEEVVTVVTVNDAVFVDSEGVPVQNVVVTAEVEALPPSDDLFDDDSQELPYFVEINTFPDDVFIDPDGPGVEVVVCQDRDVLQSRGISDALHPQLILYKVTDPKPGFPNGETQRLETEFGAEECEGYLPAPEPDGVIGFLGSALSTAVALLKPTPVNAYFLHGGLNTIVKRGYDSGDAAFSTFGATLGPNAGASVATVPGGIVGVETEIEITLRNGLDEAFHFGGDEVAVSITDGPSAGQTVAVVDNGDGTHTASYTPTGVGVDEITITLETADGWFQGPLGDSPYSSTVAPGPLLVCGTQGAYPTYATLAEAVIAADAGGTIFMCDGVASMDTDSVLVDKALTIEPEAGADVTFSGRIFVQHPTGTVTVRGLTFDFPRYGLWTAADYSDVVFDDLTFLGSSLFLGPSALTTARAMVSNSTFMGAAGFNLPGLFVSAAPYVDVWDNYFEGHEGLSSLQFQRADGTILRNEVSECGWRGCIRVARGGTVYVADNVMRTTAREAVFAPRYGTGVAAGLVVDGMDVTAEGNTIEGIVPTPGDAVPFGTYGAITAWYSEGSTTVRDNVVRTAEIGIGGRAGNLIATDNVVDDVETALSLAPVQGRTRSIVVRSNDFTNYDIAIAATDDSDPLILGSATCNWWGDANGPLVGGTTSVPPVVYTPWEATPVAGTGRTCSAQWPGFTARNLSSTTVDETGSTATFDVALDLEPSSPVVLSVVTSDPGEVTVSPLTLTFTPADWDTPQTVTVTGVADGVVDGSQIAILTIAVVDALSDDFFDDVADLLINVINTDVDSP